MGLDGVSFIVTVFDKRAYLPRVIDALARQVGPFEREFIFVDDGSSDGSAELIAELTSGWNEGAIVVRQPNLGASAASNEGARRATKTWLKFVDGDDLLVPGATRRLLEAAKSTGESFAYGELGDYRIDQAGPPPGLPPPPFALETDGLARFIRNCPCNSSSVLVSAARYRAAGGCDERLVSPDASLFLRLFASGNAVHVQGKVALVPDQAPGRLSEQRRRSRYESVLALHYLVTETAGLDQRHVKLAYRRALSRARRFHHAHGGGFFSRHLLRYLLSYVAPPVVPGEAIYRALAAFTEDGSCERPPSWQPGAMRRAATTGKA